MKTYTKNGCNNCRHRKVCKHCVEFTTYREALYAVAGSFRPYLTMPMLGNIDYISLALTCAHYIYDKYSEEEEE